MPLRDFRITYRVDGRYRAPWRRGSASQWQADSIFGRLCWGCLRTFGADVLRELLKSYQGDSPKPLLVVSNAFPAGFLPRPLGPTPPVTVGPLAERRTRFAEAKAASARQVITEQDFQVLASGGQATRGAAPTVTNATLTRAAINRLTGTTTSPGEEDEEAVGNLFPVDLTSTPRLRIYAKIDDSFVDWARVLFADLASVGVGGGASVGLGAVELEDDWWAEFDGFQEPTGANAFVALSNFVPAAADPLDGFWRMLIKYGKLGDERASSAPPGQDEAQPFKVPLLMMEAGSVFFTNSPGREWYGRLVPNVSPHYPDVVHYGLCYPAACVLNLGASLKE